jgi:hypothetical protein
MLIAVLGWALIIWIILTAAGAMWAMWLAQHRPWRFRRQVHVPREVSHVEWEEPMQDMPIPWI